jgi:periplasmic copper chaperone A
VRRALSFAPLLAGLLAATPAVAAPTATGVAVSGAWARATVTDTGGVFLTLSDHGPADELLSADTPIAAKVSFHDMVMQGDTMEMRPLGTVPLASGQMISFSPDGRHIMLESLRQPLRRGTSFPLVLHFRQAGAVTVTVPVEGPGASGPAAGPSTGTAAGPATGAR